jgi:glycine oxidase
MRVLIIGAGIMGTATALELVKRSGNRAQVTLLERAIPGAEASTAAAGILGAQAESGALPDLLPLFLKARDAYTPWLAELASTGIDVGYRKSGVLRLAFTEAEEASARALLALQARHGAKAEWLTDPWRIEPHVARSVRGSVYLADDAQVDPPKLFRALLAAVSRSAVTIRSGVTVSAIAMGPRGCIGVETDHGLLEADATVLAAGGFSALVKGVPKAAQTVRPIRGQMCDLDERTPKAQTIVFGAGSYAVPRGDGRVTCGSTMEDVGFERAVTAEGLAKLLLGATQSLPILASAEVTRTWCSFRPFVPAGASFTDGARAPLLGVSDIPGLYLATGHHRNGILLAKVTADEVATAVLDSF